MPDDTTEVTATGIARIAGVGRATVGDWRRRHPNFPKPVGGTDTGPTFSLAEVEEWLRARGKLARVPPREEAWQRIESDPDGVRAALVRAGEALLRHPENPVPGPLGELADELGPFGAYSFLLGRHLDTHPRPSRATPPETAALMAAVAGPAARVLDPACGTGGLLAAAEGPDGRARPREAHGWERDPALARLAALGLALRGNVAVHVRAGNALRDVDAAHDVTGVDVVLCHPPFGERDWGRDELAYDPRWEYGLPARTESELAWVQHALSRLRPGGTAVLLMPPAAASRRTGRRVRAALLRRGALRAVIALPAGAASPHGLSPHLWVLRRPDGGRPTPGGPEPRLLVVDASTRHQADRTADGRRKPLRDELRRTVLDAWRTFDRDGTVPGEPGVSAAPAVVDLLDEDVDLAPARCLPPAGRVDAEALTRTRADLDRALRRALHLVPVPVTPAPPQGASLQGPLPDGAGQGGARRAGVTVGELARGGALRLCPGGNGAEPAVTRPGDVVLPALGPGAAHVVEPDAAGETLDRRHWLLRPDPEVLDPWFVAGFLRGAAIPRRTAGRASTTSRPDVRRLRLPRLPLEEQRRHGRRFRELAAFETALRRAAELGEELVRDTRDAIVDGTVDPD
ncbi:N-6 DNA methylase [Streptomyces megasporus]|uniref:N-6 DNA methylase n=1 Tax=Streptomyces megasporus TaxID=44060 RepID=UPI0004E23287|nr:N-6 DNA methylase [Streptomyces megasporus]